MLLTFIFNCYWHVRTCFPLYNKPAIITQLTHPSFSTPDGFVHLWCFCCAFYFFLLFSSFSRLPMHMIVIWLAFSVNKKLTFVRTPLLTRGDLGPVCERVQLAETRLVNIPHLIYPNRSKTPFIHNHTCSWEIVRLIRPWNVIKQDESIKNRVDNIYNVFMWYRPV